MLRNIKLSTQIGIGFGIVMVIFAGLAMFSQSRLNDLDAALSDLDRAHGLAISLSDLGAGASEAAFALESYIAGNTRDGGASVLDAMQAVRDVAQALADKSIPSAALISTTKVRHMAETEEFLRLHEARRAILTEVQATGIAGRQAITDLTEALERREAPMALLSARATENFLLARVRIDRFAASANPADLDGAKAAHSETLAQFGQMSGTALSVAERRLLATAQDGVAAFWDRAEAFLGLEPDRRAALAVVERTADEITALRDEVRAEVAAVNQSLADQAHGIVKTVVWSILGGLIVAILAAGLIGTALSVTLSRRFTTTLDQTRRLAEGDLSVTITGSEARDEMGQLARALVVFRENAAKRIEQEDQASRAQQAVAQLQTRVVRDIGTGLMRLQTGDTSYRIDSPTDDPFPVEYESLRQTFNSVTASLAEVLAGISDVAVQVRTGADEITGASRDLASRAETQAATLEQSASALNTLTESVRSTAILAQDAETASRANREIAENGAAIVREAVSAMENIRKSSNQITNIIGVIDEIALQTNLLALNAGVEAARVGDAGRGFAVIASEVRGLAQRTTDSAREIKALISESAVEVEAGSTLVGKTGQSLEQILQKAAEVADHMTAIARAAGQQSSGLGEVSVGVNQLEQVTQQNAAVAEETFAAASALEQRAEELRRAMAGFVIDTGRSMHRPNGIPRHLGAQARGAGHPVATVDFRARRLQSSLTEAQS